MTVPTPVTRKRRCPRIFLGEFVVNVSEVATIARRRKSGAVRNAGVGTMRNQRPPAGSGSTVAVTYVPVYVKTSFGGDGDGYVDGGDPTVSVSNLASRRAVVAQPDRDMVAIAAEASPTPMRPNAFFISSPECRPLRRPNNNGIECEQQSGNRRMTVLESELYTPFLSPSWTPLTPPVTNVRRSITQSPGPPAAAAR